MISLALYPVDQSVHNWKSPSLNPQNVCYCRLAATRSELELVENSSFQLLDTRSLVFHNNSALNRLLRW